MAYPRDISIADAIKQYGLPLSHRVYWSKSKKADVVQAVHDRVISFHERRPKLPDHSAATSIITSLRRNGPGTIGAS